MSRAGAGNSGRDDDDERSTGPDLAAWRSQGFSPAQARVFRRWRFTLAQAVEWRQAGVPDGLRAAQWVTAGVTPATVGEWRAAGIDASQAVHWHEMGFDLPAARDAVRRGLTPDSAFTQRNPPVSPGSMPRPIGPVAHGFPDPGGRLGDLYRRFAEAKVTPQDYSARNWKGQDALAWAAADIHPADAELWRELGLTPAEAARLERKGASPAQTVRDWWQAGIPFGEVADWIGAGLTAKEAADQRARGVTAEQAAALRALRDQEEDDG